MITLLAPCSFLICKIKNLLIPLFNIYLLRALFYRREQIDNVPIRMELVILVKEQAMRKYTDASGNTSYPAMPRIEMG